MRSLVLLAALSLLFLCAISYGAPGQFETTLSTTTTSGAAVTDPRTTSPQVSRFSHQMSGRTPSLFNQSTVLTISTSTAKNDYSSFNLIDASGALKPLDYKRAEVSADLAAEFKKNHDTYIVGYGQMLTADSPFFYRGYSLAWNKSFYSGSTVIGAGLNSNDQNQPLTYYSDRREATNKLRPEKIASNKKEIWLEQVLSEQFKTQIRAFNGGRSDRPEHWGLESRNAFAINDWIFTRFDFGFLNENRNQALRDDRGYYGLTWLELQSNFEIFYDTILTLSAGTVVEREDVAWDVDVQGNSLKNQVGTDSYGVKLGFRVSTMTVGLSAMALVSNTSFKSSMLSGNLIWEL